MSTTFSVYPKNIYIPTFSEVLEVANSKLSEYLHSISLNKDICINVELQTIIEHNKIPFQMKDEVDWDKDKYAWFYIDEVAGGTDCYVYKQTDLDKEFWVEELNTKNYNQEITTIIKRSLEIGRYWSFRRSAGQPGIIALSYGLLAASLAILTDGFIFTDDGAWDYSKFPVKAEEFLTWYFRPEIATNENDRKFSEQCIEQIKNE